MIYVNSTLPAEQQNQGTQDVPPIHYWSYRPTANDLLVHHRSNRYEIRLRALLKSWDPVVFVKVFRALKKHQACMYLVTQPDLIGALPLLASKYSNRKFVTWTWMPSEVKKWNRALGACTHVLCLTEPALAAMKVAHPSVNSSLGYWEIEADYYRSRLKSTAVDVDVALVGRTRRDLDGVKGLLSDRAYSVGASARTSAQYEGSLQIDKSDDDVVGLLGASAATLIYFRGPTEEPLGYTNLVEALASGCAVAIPEDSTIPKQVLALPGIFCFKRENLQGARDALGAAVLYGRDTTNRNCIREACFDLLAVGHTSKIVGAALSQEAR